MEDYAYVLDFLPTGRPDDTRRRDPVAYGIGEGNFVLLELVPKPGASMLVGDRVFLGREGPDKESSPVAHVRGRVRYEDMTHAAQSEMRFVLETMAKEQQDRFMKFFNEAGPVTTRMHMLELLPGLGKKLMWSIVEERKKGAFKNFDEMDARVKALHQPEKLIAMRIEEELVDPAQKYHLFVQPMPPEDDHRHRRGPGGGGGYGRR